jgi:hypothetical protein
VDCGAWGVRGFVMSVLGEILLMFAVVGAAGVGAFEIITYAFDNGWL